MNGLQIFQNSEFGNVRTLEDNGKILFCGKDVATALGYSNARDAIKKHCIREGVAKRDGVSYTKNQYGKVSEQISPMSFIDEGNLYRLITHSKLPTAQRFEHWVFDDVLPSIRKNGAYGDINGIVKQCVSEVLKEIMPIIKSTQAEPQGIYGSRTVSDILTEHALLDNRMRKARTKVDDLPTDYFAKTIQHRVIDGWTFDEIANWLRKSGFDISRGALFRFFKRVTMTAVRVDGIELLTTSHELITISNNGEVKKIICG